jgi:hypothetical protein
MSIEDYQRPKTELLCPHKCGGMVFILYTDDTVKCRVCKKIVKYSDLLREY